jgi:hypothetical protein
VEAGIDGPHAHYSEKPSSLPTLQPHANSHFLLILLPRTSYF